jgi:hypothetical protein
VKDGVISQKGKYGNEIVKARRNCYEEQVDFDVSFTHQNVIK